MKRDPRGFTLVELLVVVAIVMTLGAVGFSCIRNAREKAKAMTEVNAARNLITGYLSHAAENNGRVLAGYKTDSGAVDMQGRLLFNPANARYPFRLMPSVPAVKGVIFCNENEALLDAKDGEYNVSLRPNLGINANFVGGFFGGNALLDASSDRIQSVYGKFFVSSLSEADDPGKLIVFASARESNKELGFYQVQPPSTDKRVWSSKPYKKDGNATDHGYVDFRWKGKAVTAALGGNVELLAESELRDMRRWSNQAARANDADFVLRRQ